MANISKAAFARQTKVGKLKLVRVNGTKRVNKHVGKQLARNRTCFYSRQLFSHFFVLVNSYLTCERLALHQFSESQPGWKSTIFIRLACHIYWVQKSCNTTSILHNSSLSKKAQLRENFSNLIIWRLTKAECSLTCSSTVSEKNWHFDHVPYLGTPKYFRFWLYKERSSSICKV